MIASRHHLAWGVEHLHYKQLLESNMLKTIKVAPATVNTLLSVCWKVRQQKTMQCCWQHIAQILNFLHSWPTRFQQVVGSISTYTGVNASGNMFSKSWGEGEGGIRSHNQQLYGLSRCKMLPQIACKHCLNISAPLISALSPYFVLSILTLSILLQRCILFHRQIRLMAI